jgi:hypothetical protein
MFEFPNLKIQILKKMLATVRLQVIERISVSTYYH